MSTKYHPYCYKIAWNLLANREDAEECLNDTWFSVWSQIPPTHPSVLAHFCGRITRNLSIDRLRKKFAGKRPDVHMADVMEEMEQLNVTYTVEEQLAEKELMETINRFFGRNVSKGQKYFLYEDTGFLDPVSAISKRHHMSAGSVKMNLYRNRKKLLKLLEKEGGRI